MKNIKKVTVHITETRSVEVDMEREGITTLKQAVELAKNQIPDYNTAFVSSAEVHDVVHASAPRKGRGSY